jgi:8-amino-7-oxononanoate synthase
MFPEKINSLREKSLLRTTTDRESAQGPEILIKGQEYVNFASNDYLGLAEHSYLAQKAKEALDRFGFGAGASRLLGGGTALHKELEQRTAGYKDTESALVFNSGFAANTGLIPALSDDETVLFSDELNHASIIDGCRLSRAQTIIYRHKDMSHLEALLKDTPVKKRVIITDTVFSMDGDIAPLETLISLSKDYNAKLYLDDAHGTGVLGNGRGALRHFNIKPDQGIIQMGTFSKALGSFGAFLAGTGDLIDWSINSARSFIYSTALPACIIAASHAALELLEQDSSLIRKLWENRKQTVSKIQEMGYEIMGSETPIIPIRTGSIENTLRISQHLFRNGIYAPAIRPPTVKDPRIRITVTAAHTEEDIKKLIDVLSKA